MLPFDKHNLHQPWESFFKDNENMRLLIGHHTRTHTPLWFGHVYDAHNGRLAAAGCLNQVYTDQFCWSTKLTQPY